HVKDTHLWYGALPLDQADETGLSYRRNRYYDGLSGQFTQQDPIGIAGGLNLYGYAAGDPINFSDPFGLVAWGLQRGGSRLSDHAASEEAAVEDPCMRLRTGAQRAACRSRLDAITAEDWELSEQVG